MSYYQYWLHEKDKNGRPLDERILKAVKEIISTLSRYRQQEIGCESVANEILQSAVEAASKASRNKRIANPHGYVTRVYRHFVDKFLEQYNRLVAVDYKVLEYLANSGRVNWFEEFILDRLVLQKLMKLMDPETRQIFTWKSVGYSVREIAKELHITPNAVSIRLTRGTQKAIQILHQGSLGQA